MDREKVIHGLELVKEDIRERFVSGSQICTDCLRIDEALAMLKEQERIIKQYQKADGFLFAHGWKWENYIDTQDEPHPIEVGEDGLPY